jgi:outer membrane protein TolC
MKNTTLFVLLLLFSLNLFSQGTDTVYSFSIKQAIDYAVTNHKEVVNANLETEIADAQVSETVGLGLPQISGNIDLKDYYKIPTQFVSDFISPAVYGILYNENLISELPTVDQDAIPVQFGTRYAATAGISATQLLFDPSYIVGVKASKTFREISRKNLTRTKIETAVSVTKAYYFNLLLKERKKVVDANTDRLKKLLIDTRALFDNGFVEKIDLDRVQVANNNNQTESENFARLIEISDKSLKYQIGLPLTAKLITTDSLNAEGIKNIMVETEISDPTKRIEYSILKTTETLQEYNIKRYKGQYLPSLVAYGSFNTMAQRTEFNMLDSEFGWYPTGVIGATLSLNIFDGLQRERRIKKEQLALRKINNEVIMLSDRIDMEVSSSRSTLLYAISALNTQDSNLQLANTVASTAKLKYDQGVGSNLEVLDAETLLKEAQVNYFNALYNALLAQIELNKALGKYNY